KSFTSTKAADKQSVKAGEELTYAITVTNTGDRSEERRVGKEGRSGKATYQERSTSPADTGTNNKVSWTVDVPFGESREVSFTVVVAEDLTGVESIVNAAVVTGHHTKTPRDWSSEVCSSHLKSFTSTKAADKQSVKAGEELTYTITVTNTGDVDYNGITIGEEDHTNTT